MFCALVGLMQQLYVRYIGGRKDQRQKNHLGNYFRETWERNDLKLSSVYLPTPGTWCYRQSHRNVCPDSNVELIEVAPPVICCANDSPGAGFFPSGCFSTKTVCGLRKGYFTTSKRNGKGKTEPQACQQGRTIILSLSFISIILIY